MSINIRNAEGYFDPTAFEAMTIVHKEEQAKTKQRAYMPKIFICSPFAGDVRHNTENARRYCRFAYERGCIPFAPHLFFPQFMDDDDREERDKAIFMGLVFLDGSKEVWVFGERISSGMKRKITRAIQRGIPLRYFSDSCEEVTALVGNSK